MAELRSVDDLSHRLARQQLNKWAANPSHEHEKRGSPTLAEREAAERRAFDEIITAEVERQLDAAYARQLERIATALERIAAVWESPSSRT